MTIDHGFAIASLLYKKNVSDTICTLFENNFINENLGGLATIFNSKQYFCKLISHTYTKPQTGDLESVTLYSVTKSGYGVGVWGTKM